MSFADVASMREDLALRRRLYACAAIKKAGQDPQFWVDQVVWIIVADPTWEAAWKAASSDDPGADETIITDAMIADRVGVVWEQRQDV